MLNQRGHRALCNPTPQKRTAIPAPTNAAPLLLDLCHGVAALDHCRLDRHHKLTIMQPLTFPTPKYIILHGHSNTPAPVLLSYNPPAKVWTAQPNVEDFDDAQAAITRAIELGVPPLLTTSSGLQGKALIWPLSSLWTCLILFPPGMLLPPTRGAMWCSTR